ncbi:MAG TPA: peptidylprolyl isomerase [Longimicrobiaceae bacterium]|nr:peptidylprolyl isomerase [Longimicrobiaceae bacterium]
MMRRWMGLLTGLAALAACGPRNPQVELRTPGGDIRIELYADRAPLTVAHFLRHVDEGRYATASFYRVHLSPAQLMKPASGFVQGGIWYGDTTRMLPPIPLESTRKTGLRHTDGIVSLARFDAPGSGRGEFSIMVGDQPQLDWHDDSPAGQGYAAFGKVVAGMDVVRAIQALPTNGERLRRAIPITAIRRVP